MFAWLILPHHLPQLRTTSHQLCHLICNYSFCCCLMQSTWVCLSFMSSSPPLILLLFIGHFSLEKLNELHFFSFLNNTFSIQFATLAPGFPSSLIFIFFALSLSMRFFHSFIFIPPSIFNCPPILIFPHVSCLCMHQDNAEGHLTHQCFLLISHSAYHMHSPHRDSNCHFCFNFISF